MWSTVLIIVCCAGCFPSHKAQTVIYKQYFRTADSIPDYSDLKFWAAHPEKKDPSDSVPKPLRKDNKDSSVDVFFIHPTTFTASSKAGNEWNASLSDAELNAKTDYTSILYQASVFNGSCRVYAPRYRQAHIYSFYASDTTKSKNAFAVAYSDIKKAFEQYLKFANNGRPIIIASHSQGTLHAAMLLREYFENTELQKQLVAAYIVGLYVPRESFQVLEPCRTATQTGCINTWRTYKTGYMPEFVKNEKKPGMVVNPLNWTISDEAVPRQKNQGSILYKFNKHYKKTNGAKIEQSIVWTNRPKFLFGFLLKTKNYHAGDYNLFYYSIRKNIAERIQSYHAK